jgi:hypothetical protein
VTKAQFGNVVTGFEFPHAEIGRGTRERLTAETSLPVTIFPATEVKLESEIGESVTKAQFGNVVTGFEFPHAEIGRGTRERLTAETSLPVTIFPATEVKLEKA